MEIMAKDAALKKACDQEWETITNLWEYIIIFSFYIIFSLYYNLFLYYSPFWVPPRILVVVSWQNRSCPKTVSTDRFWLPDFISQDHFWQNLRSCQKQSPSAKPVLWRPILAAGINPTRTDFDSPKWSVQTISDRQRWSQAILVVKIIPTDSIGNIIILLAKCNM